MNIKNTISKNPKFLNVFKLFRTKAIQPLFLLFHLTLKCNCNCRTCYQKHDRFYDGIKDDITADQLEKILLTVSKKYFYKPIIHFFGGEPLLNKEFDKILDITDKLGFKSSLTTNGLLLKNYYHKILSSNLNQINVSTDDIEDKHDITRQTPRCFEKSIENIKLYCNNKGRNKIININCLINERNHDRLVDLVAYFVDNRINIDTLSFQHIYYNKSVDEKKIDTEILALQI